jgi:CBS domain-containing protein
VTRDRVRDLMSHRVVTGSRDDRLADIAARMRRERVGSVVIVEAGHLIGIVTEHDLAGALADGRDPHTTAAGSVMTPRPMTIRPHDSLEAAAGLMTALGVRHLPVVEDGRPVGFLSARDVLRAEGRARSGLRGSPAEAGPGPYADRAERRSPGAEATS